MENNINENFSNKNFLNESFEKTTKDTKKEIEKNSEENLTDEEIKNNSNNRLNNVFKLLAFFSALFICGMTEIKQSINVISKNDETATALNNILSNELTNKDLFEVFFMSTGMFLIFFIISYILKELPIFENKKFNKNKIIEEADIAYKTIIENIKLSILFLYIFFILCSFLEAKKINLYTMNFWTEETFVNTEVIFLFVLSILKCINFIFDNNKNFNPKLNLFINNRAIIKDFSIARFLKNSEIIISYFVCFVFVILYQFSLQI